MNEEDNSTLLVARYYDPDKRRNSKTKRGKIEFLIIVLTNFLIIVLFLRKLKKNVYIIFGG